MATRTLCTTLALVIGLSGCAAHWERSPDHPQANFEEDQARCYLISRGMPHDGYAFAGGGTGRAGAYAAAGAGTASLGAAIGLAIQQQNDRDACMTLAGWRKVANDSIQAAAK